MLIQLQVRDFVIVDQLELEFDQGMTVVTGETGAGKSILIDALGLALGERADTSMVRPGAAQAEVSALFDVSTTSTAFSWLEAQSLTEGEECLIRRVVSAQGRSKSSINGRPVTLQQLKQLGDRLVDIHGQHEHQSLLHRSAQRDLLDRFAEHQPLCREVATAAAHCRELRKDFEQLHQSNSGQEERRDLLAYQIEELEALALSPNELPQIEEEHARLANAEQLLAACEQARLALYEAEDQNVASALARTQTSLEPFTALDSHLGEASELLSSCEIQIQEAVHAIRSAVDAVEIDPQRLHSLDQRLATIQDLARKHRVDPAELPELLDGLRDEWRSLETESGRLARIEADLEAAEQKYRELALSLRESRRKAAQALSAAVTEHMQGLAMSGGEFEISLENLNEEKPLSGGWDQVEFLVSANPGQPLRPLNKVASGGELSRISLAIQVVTTRDAPIPTLIFDEVDVGIGGAVAETVGTLLRQLGTHRQVLCVTHLPQVAALGHHHLVVNKSSDGGDTKTTIEPLQTPERVGELARMLGGAEITAQTEAHAKEMMERAQEVC